MPRDPKLHFISLRVKPPGEEQSRNDSPSLARDPLVGELAKAESELERIAREWRPPLGYAESADEARVEYDDDVLAELDRNDDFA